jgi:hypothetical protein
MCQSLACPLFRPEAVEFHIDRQWAVLGCAISLAVVAVVVTIASRQRCLAPLRNAWNGGASTSTAPIAGSPRASHRCSIRSSARRRAVPSARDAAGFANKGARRACAARKSRPNSATQAICKALSRAEPG